MNTELQIFTYGSDDVRTIMIDDEPWFVAADVCEVLEIVNVKQATDRLDNDEVCLTYIVDSVGRRQETSVVSEPGLYSLILRSDKPQAKAFKRWVTHELLPSIRKSGSYGTPKQFDEMDELERLDAYRSKLVEIKAANERLAIEEAEKIQALEQLEVASEVIASKDEEIAIKNAKIANDAIKIDHDAIKVGEYDVNAIASNGNGVRAISKRLGISPQRFGKFMRYSGWMKETMQYPLATQYAKDNAYMLDTIKKWPGGNGASPCAIFTVKGEVESMRLWDTRDTTLWQ